MIALNKQELKVEQPLPTIIAVDGALAKSGVCIIRNEEGKNYCYSYLLECKELNSYRLIYLFNQLNELVDTYEPQFACVEGYAHKAMGRVFSIGEAGGVFRLAFATKNISTVEIPPTTLKKYITGNGRADKKTMKAAIKSIFDMQFKTNDEVDAFGLAIAGLDYFNTEMSSVDSFRDYLQSTCVLLNGVHPNTMDDWDKLKVSGIRKDQLKQIAKIRKEVNGV